MELYNLNKENLEEVNLVPFRLEKDIQGLVEKNTESIFELDFIESEFRVEKYRIDTLCFDTENNCFVIIEYKKGSSYSVVDQGMTYLQLMLNNKADFLLRLSQHRGKVLQKNDIDWSQSKIIFVAESFNSYQKDSVNFDNLPFELWEIKRFTNQTVVFNKHKSNSKESVGSFTDSKKNNAFSEINKEVKVYKEGDVTSVANKVVLEKWEELKDLMIELAGTELEIKRNYISLVLEDKSNKTVAYFNFQKNGIRMDFSRGNLKTDGTTSKNYFTLDDPKKIAKESSWTWKSGVKGTVYRITISDNADMDYMMFLIKQKYKNLRH
jgi:predicted transport protein